MVKQDVLNSLTSENQDMP